MVLEFLRFLRDKVRALGREKVCEEREGDKEWRWFLARGTNFSDISLGFKQGFTLQYFYSLCGFLNVFGCEL